MIDKAKLETINHFFKVHGKSSDRCHEASEECNQPAIRAHSIPNGTVLSTLEEKGHVIMPEMKLKISSPTETSFELVGINKATTFTGLCSKHDTEIFRPIDVGVPDLNNPAQLFLLSYRAVLREYHACLQNALRFQSTYQKRVDVGLSPDSEPDDYGMFTMGHLINAYECYEYKRQFDKFYLDADWSKLQHHIIILQNQQPSIAVSSMFSLDEIDVTETPRLTLSLFPANGQVLVAFSALKNDATDVSTYLDRILSSEGYFQKYLLSKLILQSCENFVISPVYYNALSQERKDALLKYFVDTIQENDSDREDENLYLF